MGDVSQVLSAIGQGDPRAAEELLPLVYAELRRLAAHRLREKPGHTLDATALVHEAYVRLVGAGADADQWNSRGHFFAAAAEGMRRILVESARRKQRLRHGGGMQRHDADVLEVESPQPPEELIALSEALDKLGEANAQAAQLVKLRYFAGLTNEEAAAALVVSPRKATQIWAYARAWLLACLGREAI